MAAYLPPDLARRVRTHAKTSRRSVSSVIAEAVAAYFDRLDHIAELEPCPSDPRNSRMKKAQGMLQSRG